MTRDEITAAVIAARIEREITWQSLADAIGRPVMWTTAALPALRVAHGLIARRRRTRSDLARNACALLDVYPVILYVSPGG